MAQSLKKTIPILTAELFSIPLEKDQYVIYAPLRRSAMVTNARGVNFLADLQEGIYDHDANSDGALIELLRYLEILDAVPEKTPITIFTGSPEPTSLSLFLTTACNLRCTYCYASAGDTPLKQMAFETAKRGINFVAGNAVKKNIPCFEIAYHGGGEPSTNWKTMTESLAYAKAKASDLGLAIHASAASNGVLSDEQIDWVISNLNGMSISFDGLPTVHDKHRLTPTGKGSSSKVIQTLNRFDRAGFPYGIRMTVTKDQIPLLPDSVAFVSKNFKPARIQVEPSYQMGRWNSAPSAETIEFIEAFRKAQEQAHSYGQEITYSAARLDILTNHFCGVTQDSFCLSPDGNVSGCYENFSEDNEFADTFFYGNPAGELDGYSFDLPVLNNLRQQAVQHRPYCEGCFAKWHCAGDCYNKALTVNGTGEFAGSDRCHITRELTKDQILSKITASGGNFWYDPIKTAINDG